MGKYRELLSAMEAFDAQSWFAEEDAKTRVPAPLADFVDKLSMAAASHYSAGLLQKQMQFSALQSQINPHFLYNTLEAIRSEALTAGNGNIAEMTEKLSRFFRYCISSRDDFVPLRAEIFNLEDYFYIQQYRFGDRFSFVKEIEDDELLRCLLPKMTLQPIVENAIFHGLEQKKGQGTIVLRVMRTDKKVYIRLEDDGVGMPMKAVDELNQKLRHPQQAAQSALRQKGGIALPNVNARIRLHFGEEYGLRINSVLYKGTDVEVVLPWLTDLKGAANLDDGVVD